MMYGWFGPGWENYIVAQDNTPPKRKKSEPNPEVKVEEMFTLSIYSHGTHRTHGEIRESDIEEERLTFSESLLPFKEMIQKFKDCRLGSKLKVTIEVID